MWSQWLVWSTGAYMAMGVLFGVAFVVKGAAALDSAAGRSGWGFRSMIFPGAVALWPWLARRWWYQERGQ